MSKNKLKVFGKVNLIPVLYTESHQSWCRCLRPRAATNNVRLVFVYGKPNVTRAQFLSFNTTVWEIETTCWEIQEKRKHFERQKWQIEVEQHWGGKSVCIRRLWPHTSAKQKPLSPFFYFLDSRSTCKSDIFLATTVLFRYSPLRTSEQDEFFGVFFGGAKQQAENPSVFAGYIVIE